MDFMQQAPALSLAVLALIDATGIGTLVIPIWLLLRRDHRVVVPRVLLYLVVMAGFYWVAGVLLHAGWQLGRIGGLGTLLDTRAAHAVKLAIGAGLLAWALLTPRKGRNARGSAPVGTGVMTLPASMPITGSRIRSTVAARDARQRPGRPDQPAVSGGLGRRLGGALDSSSAVVVLALLAGLLELPTMLPYLGALGLMQSLGWHTPVQLAVLFAYCVVMILPALGLTLIRRAAGDRVEALLGRLGAGVNAFAAESLAWVAGIVGFLLLRSAAIELQVLGFLH